MSLFKTLLFLTVFFLAVSQNTALAATPEEKSDIENLKRRIAILEAERSGQPHIADQKPLMLGKFSDHVTLSGQLEVEAYYAGQEGGEEESNINLVKDEALYSSSVDGAGAFLSFHGDHFGVETEYLTALEDFDPALVEVGDELTGRRPEAWDLEVAWMPTERILMAVRYEQANDFQDDVPAMAQPPPTACMNMSSWPWNISIPTPRAWTTTLSTPPQVKPP